jgi:hypothetical protein
MPTRTHLQSASEGESPLAGTRLVARLLAPANPPLTGTRTHTDTHTHTFRSSHPATWPGQAQDPGRGGAGGGAMIPRLLLYMHTFRFVPPGRVARAGPGSESGVGRG